MHFSNALPPISVTELGIVTEVSDMHSRNASVPISVTEYVAPS